MQAGTLGTAGTASFGQTMQAADVAEVRVLSHDQMRVELADPRVRFYSPPAPSTTITARSAGSARAAPR